MYPGAELGRVVLMRGLGLGDLYPQRRNVAFQLLLARQRLPSHIALN
jgi:hypothetical protein